MNDRRPPIDVRGLTRRWPGAAMPAIDDLTFSVQGGETYCLLGGTGAGKTTTMRLLLGLLSPSAGRAWLASREVTTTTLDARRQATLVSGEGMLCGAMTARQNLSFLVRLAEPTRPWRDADGRNAMRTMGIPERAFEQRVRALPRDLVVALWLAVAWLRQTPVLLLDEPAAGLDNRATAGLQTNLDRFRTRGQAIMMATTDILLASQIADRIGILKAGRKVAERVRAEVLNLSLTELYVEYVGHPPRRVSLEHPIEPRRLGR